MTLRQHAQSGRGGGYTHKPTPANQCDATGTGAIQRQHIMELAVLRLWISFPGAELPGRIWVLLTDIFPVILANKAQGLKHQVFLQCCWVNLPANSGGQHTQNLN